MKKFYSEARGRNQYSVVLIIPTARDFVYFKKHGGWPYGNLVKKLRSENLDYIDAGPAIWEYLKGQDVTRLYVSLNGHLNEEGYSALAGVIYQYLKMKGRL